MYRVEFCEEPWGGQAEMVRVAKMILMLMNLQTAGSPTMNRETEDRKTQLAFAEATVMVTKEMEEKAMKIMTY